MMLAPMTFLVTLGLIFAVVVGVIVLIRALDGGTRKQRSGRSGANIACPHCAATNPAEAQYCSRCGKVLAAP